ncbi:hypothetical protein [Streptomyces sp. NPDC048659]|uniref:hypothetical protein n=1 Tax=Streptomyces sp. NPDC048659 TaxID=3155489 RepID=UPI0034337619
MDTDSPRPATRRPRPSRAVTATATATGSALAVALLPLVVGALVARTAGGDPMVSVNALIAGGGQRARLSRTQLRGCGGRAFATARSTARGAWVRSSARWASGKPGAAAPAWRGRTRPTGRR